MCALRISTVGTRIEKKMHFFLFLVFTMRAKWAEEKHNAENKDNCGKINNRPWAEKQCRTALSYMYLLQGHFSLFLYGAMITAGQNSDVLLRCIATLKIQVDIGITAPSFNPLSFYPKGWDSPPSGSFDLNSSAHIIAACHWSDTSRGGCAVCYAGHLPVCKSHGFST